MDNTNNPLHTLREDPLNAETTIRELIEPQQPNILLGQLMHFREYLVTKPLPTKGSEADLYLIQKEGQDFILKLYRNAMAPKQEVLGKIWALSRDNPHQLVSILDVGFDAASARWYEIMEYLPLGSLRDIAFCWSDRRSFVLAMIHELTRSLHLLHQNEIVHCDLKPSNVLIRSCNPLDLILTDFGIASQMASGVSLKMTSHKGTPMYWAPEAFSGLVAPASDWWGLGIIALEYLVGKHPFDGFGQQQITYQLTVKNVEVPAGLGDMEMLLKGILTKDAAKRWGYEQITRWLAGERDIPVYYENPEELQTELKGSKQRVVSFRFEGQELHSLDEIALAFAKNEESWKLGTQYLRYVRQWLETNGEFDKAIQLGEMLTGKTDTDLFHFIHSNAKLPFIFMGKTISDKALLEYMHASETQNASQNSAITEAIDSGLLLELLDDYSRNHSISPDSLRPLLIFLRDIAKNNRSSYIDVLVHPEEYLWPGEPPLFGYSDVMIHLQEFKSPPVKRSFIERLQAQYILPDALVERLETVENYHSAMKEIQEMEEEALLLKRNTAAKDGDCDQERALDLESYKSLAKKRNWVLDEEMERSIALSCARLSSIDQVMQTDMEQNWVIHRLQGIRFKRVTQSDRDFVSHVDAIIQRNAPHEQTENTKPADYVSFLIPAAAMLSFIFFPMSDVMMIKVFHTMTLLLGFGSLFFLAVLAHYLSNYGAREINRRIIIAGLITIFSLLLSGGILGSEDSASSAISSPALWRFLYHNIFLLRTFRFISGFMIIGWLWMRWKKRKINGDRECYRNILDELELLR